MKQTHQMCELRSSVCVCVLMCVCVCVPARLSRRMPVPLIVSKETYSIAKKTYRNVTCVMGTFLSVPFRAIIKYVKRDLFV